MKKTSTFLFSALLMAGAMTTWANADKIGALREAAASPQSVNALADDAASLSLKLSWGEGETFEGKFPVNKLSLTFSEKTVEMIGEITMVHDETGVSKVIPANMKMVGIFGSATLLGNPVEGLTDNTTLPGSYTLTIPAGTFRSTATQAVNEELVAHYNIIPASPKITEVTPQRGYKVEKFEGVTFKFDIPVEYYGSATVDVKDNKNQFGDPVGSAAVSLSDDETELVFSIAEPITEAGVYFLDFEPSDIVSKGGGVEWQCDDFASWVWEVEPPKEPEEPEVPAGPLSMTMASTCLDGAVFEDYFPNFTIVFEESTLEATVPSIALKNETTGTVYNLSINTNFLQWGEKSVLLMAANILEPEAGNYTLTIPAGAFRSTATRAVNEEFTVHYTLRNQSSVIDPVEDFELVSFKYYKKNIDGSFEAPVELKNGGVTLNVVADDKFEIETNVNDACGVVYVKVYEGNMEIDQTTGLDLTPAKRSMFTTTKNDAGNFQIIVSGDGVELEKGKEYTFSVFGMDTENKAPADRNYFGFTQINGNVIDPITFKVTGDATEFIYSDVKFVSIDPPLTREIVDENQEFVVTFSAPVTIPGEEKGQVVSGLNTGSGTAAAFKQLRKVDVEGTQWLFQPYPEMIADATAQIDFFLKVRDAQGLIVRPESDTDNMKENTRFKFAYDCHLGSPLVEISPASGTLESIFSFEASNYGKNIDMGSALDKPYLTTPSGARVAEVDMNSVKRFDRYGNSLEELGNVDVTCAKITFSLDREITAAGKYILHCPFAAFSLGTEHDGASSRTMNVSYIIEGTPQIDGCSVEEGAELSEITFIGFYCNNEVAPASEGRVVRMQLRDEESTLGNYDVIYANNNGRTIILGDFSENGKAFALEPGMEYTVRINEGALAIAGTDMIYPEISVRFKGASVDKPAPAPEFVKLTHSVSDHTAVVSEVVKGKEAVINLTPAAGWKLDKVTLDGEDVTGDVKDNVYTTPALEDDAVVDVTMAYDGIVFAPASADEVVSDFNLRAWSEGGQIFVAGLELGMKLDVFTVGGALAGSYVADDTAVSCKVAEGVYVVVVTDKNGKSQAIKIQNK